MNTYVSCKRRVKSLKQHKLNGKLYAKQAQKVYCNLTNIVKDKKEDFISTLLQIIGGVTVFASTMCVMCLSMPPLMTVEAQANEVPVARIVEPVTATTVEFKEEVVLASTPNPIHEFVEVYEPVIVEVAPTEMEHGGVMVQTNTVTINVDDLLYAYNNPPALSFDYKEKAEVINCLWEFLVNQQGVSPEIASAIIGAVVHEGRFGEQQGTHDILTSYDTVVSKLGGGTRGYGIAQWTFYTRQDALRNYYGLADELFPDDWETAMIIAECSMLYEELKVYDIFDDLSSHVTIEDAVGKISVLYEGYAGCSDHWECSGGVYRLASNSKSGSARLDYAYNIYEYYTTE